MLYTLDPEGTARAVPPIRTRNEAAELQTVLARNLDLLPGDQIDPESPRRSLLIREEVPVPDPGGAGSRWSVDLLLTDQSGTPTFVACKRYADTRSRREVVGQMLEYAANGHHYWDRVEIHRYIEETAARAGQVRLVFFMEEALPSLFGYTEEARRAKRSVHVDTGRKRRMWNEEEFMPEPTMPRWKPGASQRRRGCRLVHLLAWRTDQ